MPESSPSAAAAPTLDFSGQVVLITGATRGIGAAVAADLERAGADLILTGTNPQAIAEANRDSVKRGRRVRYLQADFSDDASTAKFLGELSRIPRIDVCINNAGINKIDPIYDLTPADYERVTRVNLGAPTMICAAVCSTMKQAGYGRIVNIASIWSTATKAGRALYSMTKTGLVGLTRTVAVDMAPYNVLANAVSPGFTRTELTASTLSASDAAALAAQVPLNRFAEPAEISKVIVFLASGLNTYLTGQNIVVDGGFTLV
jgi:3-oxoacyl-[acyl-carrier protein] reductase